MSYHRSPRESKQKTLRCSQLLNGPFSILLKWQENCRRFANMQKTMQYYVTKQTTCFISCRGRISCIVVLILSPRDVCHRNVTLSREILGASFSKYIPESPTCYDKKLHPGLHQELSDTSVLFFDLRPDF